MGTAAVATEEHSFYDPQGLFSPSRRRSAGKAGKEDASDGKGKLGGVDNDSASTRGRRDVSGSFGSLKVNSQPGLQVSRLSLCPLVPRTI